MVRFKIRAVYGMSFVMEPVHPSRRKTPLTNLVKMGMNERTIRR